MPVAQQDVVLRKPSLPGASRDNPSIRKIAAAMGVSVATVSRALNNHPNVSASMRRRVLDAARDMGYVRSIGKRPTDYIALTYPADTASPQFGGFESLIVTGVLQAASDAGFNVAVLNASQDKHEVEDYIEFLERKCAQGTVLRGHGAAAVASELADAGFPAVLIAERSDDPRVCFVDAESRRTSQDAVAHLIELGHRRIAIGVRHSIDTDHLDRLNGYADALREAGIPYDESLVVQSTNDQAGGVDMLDRLLALPRPPTAIYFTRPLATVGALYRCAELGINVPRDMSIIGFDESDARLQTFPRYTAVCQNAKQLAIDATKWLIEEIRRPTGEPFRDLRTTTFAVLESTGPAPDNGRS